MAMSWRVSARNARPLPSGFIQPCIATESTKVPAGPGWVHEIKHDGYRMQLRKEGDRVRLFTRRGFDWTERYRRPIEAARALKARSCTIDGEMVVAGDDGISNFDMLQSRGFDDHAFMYAFDLLELEGDDLRRRPLGERKEKLERDPPEQCRHSPLRAPRRRRQGALCSRLPHGPGRHRLEEDR